MVQRPLFNYRSPMQSNPEEFSATPKTSDFYSKIPQNEVELAVFVAVEKHVEFVRQVEFVLLEEDIRHIEEIQHILEIRGDLVQTQTK